MNVTEFLEWAYGPWVRKRFVEKMSVGQRAGQAFMNVLSYYDLGEYNRLSGSLVDPFYDDKKIPAAIDRLTSK